MEHLDLITMATNAGGIPEGRQSVRLRVMHLDHLATRIIQAAGAARAQIDPAPVVRNAEGTWYHPALPKLDGSFRLDWFAYANGLDAKFVAMDEADLTPEALDRYHNSPAGDFSGWTPTPTPPAGKGWFCLAIYDDEDGPHAVFVRQPRQKEQRND